MPTTQTSPFMNITVPINGVDPSPDWGARIQAALFSTIDAHDHSNGKGVQIKPSGLNINADLAFGSNNATLLRSTRFASQSSAFASGSDIGAAYVLNGDLYYRDIAGNNVQITKAGAVNAGSVSAPTLSGNFTQPVVNAVGTANVTSVASFAQFQSITIAGNYYICTAVGGGTLSLLNVGGTNSIAGTVIPSGSAVAIAGQGAPIATTARKAGQVLALSGGVDTPQGHKPVLNVLSYGATLNSVDDNAATQAALDAAGTNASTGNGGPCTVYVPATSPLSYTSKPLIVSSNTRLIGEDRQKTLIRALYFGQVVHMGPPPITTMPLVTHGNFTCLSTKSTVDTLNPRFLFLGECPTATINGAPQFSFEIFVYTNSFGAGDSAIIAHSTGAIGSRAEDTGTGFALTANTDGSVRATLEVAGGGGTTTTTGNVTLPRQGLTVVLPVTSAAGATRGHLGTISDGTHTAEFVVTDISGTNVTVRIHEPEIWSGSAYTVNSAASTVVSSGATVTWAGAITVGNTGTALQVGKLQKIEVSYDGAHLRLYLGDGSGTAKFQSSVAATGVCVQRYFEQFMVGRSYSHTPFGFPNTGHDMDFDSVRFGWAARHTTNADYSQETTELPYTGGTNRLAVNFSTTYRDLFVFSNTTDPNFLSANAWFYVHGQSGNAGTTPGDGIVLENIALQSLGSVAVFEELMLRSTIEGVRMIGGGLWKHNNCYVPGNVRADIVNAGYAQPPSLPRAIWQCSGLTTTANSGYGKFSGQIAGKAPIMVAGGYGAPSLESVYLNATCDIAVLMNGFTAGGLSQYCSYLTTLSDEAADFRVASLWCFSVAEVEVVSGSLSATASVGCEAGHFDTCPAVRCSSLIESIPATDGIGCVAMTAAVTGNMVQGNAGGDFVIKANTGVVVVTPLKFASKRFDFTAGEVSGGVGTKTISPNDCMYGTLIITDSGSRLSGTSRVNLAFIVEGYVWYVRNTTTQTLNIFGPSGTSTPISSGATGRVGPDGTNMVTA